MSLKMSVLLIKFGIKLNLSLPGNDKHNRVLEFSLSYLLAKNMFLTNHSNYNFYKNISPILLHRKMIRQWHSCVVSMKS